jgi:hypothetical protein
MSPNGIIYVQSMLATGAACNDAIVLARSVLADFLVSIR